MELKQIPNAPSSIFYLADFISESEEKSILDSIPSNQWITLSHRRLQAVPSRLSATNTLIASPMPPWLTQPILQRFRDLSIFDEAPHHGPNHCLINEYLPGQGIMPHEDGDAYHPVVATVSLAASTVLDVGEKADRENAGNGARRTWRILQEPRSLLVTTGSAYTDALHGIAPVVCDSSLSEETVVNWDLLRPETREDIRASGGRRERETRVSLTFRDVRKVSNLASKLFGKPRG